jgi:hypothetical protein
MEISSENGSTTLHPGPMIPYEEEGGELSFCNPGSSQKINRLFVLLDAHFKAISLVLWCSYCQRRDHMTPLSSSVSYVRALICDSNPDA